MKTIFKKSLVALALTGAALSVQAADVNVTAGANQAFGQEGLATVSGTAVNVTLGLNSTVAPTFEVESATPLDALIRVQFNTNFTTGSAAPTMPATITTTGTKTLTLANSGANFVVYRVTTAGGLLAGDTFSFSAAKFPASAVLAAGGIKVTVTTENGSTGAAIDSVEDAVLAEVKKVRKFDFVTKANATIDVAKGRTAFSGTVTPLETSNALTAVAAYGVSYKSIKGSIKGNFSWVKDTDADTAGIQAPAGVLAVGANCTAGDLTATELKFTCEGNGTPGLEVSLQDNTDSKPDAGVATILSETSFVLDATVDFSNTLGLASNSAKAFDAAAAGSWKLNGSNVLIPYMVYGTVGGKAYNQVIQLTNNSTVEGAIYVDIFDGEGKQIAKNQKLTAVAKANSVVNVGTEIKALVAAAKYEGKVSVRVVAEVPSASTEVYAAYQDVATSERAIVVGLTTKAN